jgi:hypothetical protein
MHDGLGIREWTDADIIALDGVNESFSHSVALRAFDRLVLGSGPMSRAELRGTHPVKATA